MHINKISIQNFKSIYEPLTIDFDKDFQGFWKLSGPVGSGKTSIGEAILFGLFGSVGGKTNGSLISWGRKHGLVEMWLESQGHNIYIKREMNIYGQSPVYVEIDGQEMIYTDKRNAQSTLEEEYYDTSRTALELLCIISFNNFKSLVTLNAKDSRQFLDQVLGISSLAPYIESCQCLTRDTSIQIQGLQARIRSYQAQIQKIKELQSKTHVDGDPASVRSDISRLNDLISETRKKADEVLSSLQKKIREQSMNLASLQTKGSAISKNINFIKKGKCPTCGHDIDQSSLPSLEKERMDLLSQYSKVKEGIENLEKEQSKEKATLQSILQPLTASLADQTHLLSVLQEQSKRQAVSRDEIEGLQRDLDEAQSLVEDLEKDMVQWDELSRILSQDVKQYIISSFIPALNQNIDTFARRLSLPYSVTFDNQFKCTITLEAISNEIPISSLSTGQLKIVDMIVILGVLGTVMGQGSLNVMFLDELFSNLNKDAGDEVVSLLREFVDPSSSVFIISHTEIDDRGFDGVLALKLEHNKEDDRFHSHWNVVRFDQGNVKGQ